VAIIGFVVNTIVAVYAKKLPTMNNPFGHLSASQATGEAILCGNFAFFIAPAVFL
jgi:hypothetical protein